MKRNNNNNNDREEVEEDIININIIPILPSNNSKKRYDVTAKRFLYNNFMMSCDNFFQSEECKKWIEYAENIGFQLQFHEATKDIAYRNNYRLQFNDDNLANNIFQRISDILPDNINIIDNKKAVTCSPNIRIYKYIKNQAFGCHIDESNNINHLISKCTVLIYLNDIYKGGKTIFYSGTIKKKKLLHEIIPIEGRLLIHGHGHRCLLHEGEIIEEGIKYVLRTDILYN